MKFTAEINIMPQKALLDPQGKAVKNTAQKAGYKGIIDVRIGKHIVIEIEAKDRDKAEKEIEELCKNMLSNPVIESYSFVIKNTD